MYEISPWLWQFGNGKQHLEDYSAFYWQTQLLSEGSKPGVATLCNHQATSSQKGISYDKKLILG